MTLPDNNGFQLPTIIDPERICVRLFIPNEINHIRAFWGILLELTQQWNWSRDAEHTAAPVAAVWMDVWKKARDSFYANECGDTTGCREYYLSSPLISFYPCSPYNPECDLPEGYNHAPFTVVGQGNLSEIIGVYGFGYGVGDVYTDLTKLPPGSFPEVLAGWRYFPRISITTPPGSGTVKINFLNIPQGGRAFIVLDDDFLPLAGRLVELNKDLLSVPPETAVPNTYTLEVTGEGAHLVEIAFLPTVDEAFIPLFFGGGIRSIELCGFGMTGDDTVSCCPETNHLNRRILAQNNYSQSFIYQMLDDGTPQSFAPDAPTHFDSNDGDTSPASRNQAICDAVRRYVWSVLEGVVYNYAIADDISDIIALFPPFALVAGAINAAVDIAQSAVQGLVNDTEAVNNVICAMTDGLRAQEISHPNFRDSLNPGDFEPGSNEFQIAVIVDINNAMIANYRAFVSILGGEYERLSAGGQSDCPCGCVEEIEIYDYAATGCIITHVEGDIWRFQQSTPDGDGRYRASMRNAFGGCLHVEFAPAPYTHQGVGGNNSHGCCGTADYSGWHFGGGFAPTFLKDVIWWTGDPMDTYYKVTCVDEEECE